MMEKTSKEYAEKLAESVAIDGLSWENELSKGSYIQGYLKALEETNAWTPVLKELPKPLQTVWITNGKGWTTLGCLVEMEDGWHWAQTNGVIYEENGEIVSECESDDLDVTHWHPLPKPIRI